MRVDSARDRARRLYDGHAIPFLFEVVGWHARPAKETVSSKLHACVAVSTPVATRHDKDRPGSDSRDLATFVGDYFDVDASLNDLQKDLPSRGCLRQDACLG
jgi:hypothetical protein